MIAATVAGCEIAFWLLLVGGLTARYVLGRARLGAILLVSVPVVDLVLLTVTAIDLANGARANWTHGLAMVYLGVAVVFGPALIRSADRRFADRFADDRHSRDVHASTEDSLAAQWHPSGRRVRARVVASGVDVNDSHNSSPGRWAPWWAYLAPILGGNYLRQALLPPARVGDAVSIALAVATAGTIAAVVTALYRRPR